MAKRPAAILLALGTLAVSACTEPECSDGSSGDCRRAVELDASAEAGAVEDAGLDVDAGDDASRPTSCERDGDCDDGIACTRDFCEQSRCLARPDAELCPLGTSCDLRESSCVQGRACAIDDDCRDEDPCTTNERCLPSPRVCAFRLLDGDGDGDVARSCGGLDCDDDQNHVFSGAPELCDELDNDCDGARDQPLSATACDTDRSCLNGSCVCSGDRMECNSSCVDVRTDPEHCGDCTTECPTGGSCESSECVCPEGQRDCDGVCRDQLWFEDEGKDVCGGACIDIRHDSRNCGSCSKRCAACDTGACIHVEDFSVGEYHACALLSNGREFCWGSGDSGAVGDGTDAVREAPVLVRDVIEQVPLESVEQLGAGEGVSCALLTGGSVACWGGAGGLGGNGREGPSDPLWAGPVMVFTSDFTLDYPLTGMARLKFGGNQASCAINANQEAYCWGRLPWVDFNERTTARRLPFDDVLDLAIAGHNVCVLRSNGEVHCVGSNDYGQLGNATSSSGDDFVRVETAVGTPLLGSAELHMTRDTTCALLEDGTVRCWGLAVGDGSGMASMKPVAVEIADGVALSDVVSLAAGGDFGFSPAPLLCATRENGEVYCWGNNDYGQLGHGTTSQQTTETRAVRVEIADGVALSGVKHVAVGKRSVCAALDSGEVYCWGRNEGILGDGTLEHRSRAVRVEVSPGVPLSTVERVKGTANTFCALLANKDLACWGSDSFGQVGSGAGYGGARAELVAWP